MKSGFLHAFRLPKVKARPPVKTAVASRRVVSVDLPPEPSSATRARQLAREHVAECPPEVIDTVALLVTELVTNAVLHARTELHLVIETEPGVVRLRVEDHSPGTPVIRNYGTDDVTGRGLALVDMIATRWGVDPRPGGKAVWCEIDIPSPDQDGQ
jgi:anti-sigma regulatory factor (Ser/Thr protein kinase)